jgi:hypothetical protein
VWPIRLNVLLGVEDVGRERRVFPGVDLKLTHISLSRTDRGVIAPRHHGQITALTYLLDTNDVQRANSIVSGLWTKV